MTTLSFPRQFLPNLENESAEALRRIRVYSGALHGHRRRVGGRVIKNAESLGGIPFGKMDALEAVAISDVRGKYKGSFSSLLLRPSLKLLQMSIAWEASEDVLINGIVKDLAGRRADQVETMVLLGSHCERDCLKSLRELLALFPNLKCLRVRAAGSLVACCVDLGCLVHANLRQLSELVLEEDPIFDFLDSVMGDKILEVLGLRWGLAPVPRGCVKSSLRFVADGRDRAEFSCFFFEDKFFSVNEP